jgi:hypothetical protein
MVKVGAPVTVQLSVLGWPAATLAGVATKLVMVGGLPTGTVTAAVAEPNALVAVSV